MVSMWKQYEASFKAKVALTGEALYLVVAACIPENQHSKKVL
jgi:hypothetical protein